MGNYNPDAPQILGQEWVPIRNENAIFSPAVNSIEVGHTFQIAAPHVLSTARFYINELKPLSDRGQTFMAAIYPEGLEDQSGPISSLLVPCNAATLTNATTSGAATAVEALLTQSTSSGISLDCSQPNTGLALSFALSSYSAPLSGKRILGVNLITGTAASSDITGPTRTTSTSIIKVSTTATIGSTTDPEAIFGRLRVDTDLDRAAYGEINQFWTANSPLSIADRVPWTYAQLTRLDAVATRLYTRIETGTNRGTTANSSCYIFYAALEIIYCEEQRVAVGATQFGTSNSSHSFGAESVLGTNQIIMHSMASALNPVLPAGDYLLVLSSADVGGLNDNQAQLTSDYPNLNAARELYTISPHVGTQVNIPFPLIDHIGDTFTSEVTHILPQVTLHATGGTMTEPHVYGRSIAAQVYGTITATQEINDDIVGVATSYPQVRFYARRFGDTTIPLTLSGGPGGMLLPGTSGNYASTPDAAALDIIGDIELQVDVTMAAATWNTGTPTFLAKWNGAQRSYRLDLNGSGAISMIWSTTGADTNTLTSTAAVPTSTSRLAIRVTFDVNNGGGGSTATFYTAPTISGPWTQLGAPVIGAVTNIFASTAQGEVGGRNAGTSGLFAGTVHAAKILNGIAGTEVANPDFDAQTAGTAVFADAAGRTWTLNGTAAIIGSVDGSSVSITPTDFDALVEILDGWREVTLRFGTPPTMGTLTTPEPSFTWSAAGETAGNRWEILGASAPAISGIPTNLFNLVPSPNQLYEGTYQPPPPGGSTAELTWMPQGVGSPYVSIPSADDSTDAVLIFSQDPPTVTGFTLTPQTQTVTGIALDCGTLPCCIPTGISYQQLSWSAVEMSLTALSLPGVTGNYAWTPDAASLDIVGDLTLSADVTLSDWGSGAVQTFLAKTASPSDRSYWFRLDSTGMLNLLASSDGASFQVNTLSTTAPVPPSSGRLAVRASIDVNNGAGGNTVTFFTAPTMAGPWTQLGSAVVNVGTIAIFNGAAELWAGLASNATPGPLDGYIHAAEVINSAGTTVANPNFSAQPAGTTSFVDTATPAKTWTLAGSSAAIVAVSSGGLGAYELQRFDDYNASGDFETIMLSTDTSVLSFNDYEARVGITSVYRIRALNSLNFAGAWSAYVSGAPPTPGVTGGCDDQTGALIFTSNADQTGANNAAYVMQWDNAPVEDFQLPEADMVTYQPVYGRDGSIAFHGTERGLEVFDRTVLLHAAAIDPIRLADARTIRDLAWADLPYVCVRDDIGDRWFSSVRVPNVNARLNRTKYMARIEIVETTQTPYPVDP